MSQRKAPIPGGPPAFLEDVAPRPGLREFVFLIRGEACAIRVEVAQSLIGEPIIDEFLDAGEAVLAKRLPTELAGARLNLIR